MPTFPSIEWFNAVRDATNQDSRLRSLGTCDTAVGVKVEEHVFRIDFEAFECADVTEIDETGLLETDFFLDLPAEAWVDLLKNIKSNNGADAAHTLNRLDITHPDGIVHSHDELRRLAFLRYHLSIQSFFDASAQVETTFA